MKDERLGILLLTKKITFDKLLFYYTVYNKLVKCKIHCELLGTVAFKWLIVIVCKALETSEEKTDLGRMYMHKT